jgi:hypothetical protein
MGTPQDMLGKPDGTLPLHLLSMPHAPACCCRK